MAKDSATGNWFSSLFKPSETETTYLHKGEILVVFLIAFIIAITLWFLVNMGKEYNVTMALPLQITDVSEDMAFATDPPGEARVTVSGEGWNLLSLYRNPPVVSIPYSDNVVNVSDIVQREIAYFSDISVQKVEPSIITLNMEPRTSKRVPVTPKLDVQLRAQFEIVGNVRVSPDSVTVQGARSVVDTLQSMPTETLRLSNVQKDVDRRVGLANLEGVAVPDAPDVNITFSVTEFTEGEVRLRVQARNVPEGREVRFNPTVLTVRYNVPIDQFSLSQDIVPYEAYVPYSEFLQDTTGYVVPNIAAVTDELDIRLQSIQPRRVAYFLAVTE